MDEEGAISANIRWSDSGANYLTEVDLEPGFTSTDQLLVINGQPATTPSGGVIRAGLARSHRRRGTGRRDLGPGWTLRHQQRG